MSYDFQLVYWMKNASNFVGVYSSDKLPFEKGDIICNLDSSNLVGSHWIAVRFTKTKIYYFDPLAWIPVRCICIHLGFFGLPILYITKNVQSFSSLTCGIHCVFFLLHNYPAENDKEALRFINKHANKQNINVPLVAF